jgi:hypothetical protein
MSLCRCNGCDKRRRDVKSIGKDSNGDPDAPDLCFTCRKMVSRGQRLPTDSTPTILILRGTVWMGHTK